MGYRYCPDCQKWNSMDWTIDSLGCPVCTLHNTVTTGYLPGDIPHSIETFNKENNMHDNYDELLHQAKLQDLVVGD